MKTSLERVSDEITWTDDITEKIKTKGYVIGPKIGYGTFSAVFKCTNKNQQLAVKVIDLRKASPAYRDKFFPRELKVIQAVKHRHVIQTVDVFIDNPKPNLVFIFMSLAKCDLLTVIEKSKDKKIPDGQARKWMRHVSSGLKYLHFKLIAHRDMKVENILIDFKDNALISDFGFVRSFADNKQRSMDNIKKELNGQSNQMNVVSETYCGSIQYASPEILINQPYNPFPADIWSFGVLIAATLTGKIIFEGQLRDQITIEQLKVHELINQTEGITNLAKDLLHRMMQLNPKERWIISQIIDHEWIAVSSSSRESAKSRDSKKSNK